MKKTTTLILLTTLLLLMTIFVTFAPAPTWYDNSLPSATLTEKGKTDLIADNKYVWNSNAITKNGRCYYYDLSVGYEYQYYDNYSKQTITATNYTWSDSNRELTCTDKNLSQTELEQLQLNNIAWTLNQLTPQKPEIKEVINIPAQKGENLKDKSIISDGAVVGGK